MGDALLRQKIEEERRHLIVHDALAHDRPALRAVPRRRIVLVVDEILIRIVRRIDDLCFTLIKSLFTLHCHPAFLLKQ